MTNTPPHLGGHANVTHIDEGALRYFQRKHGAESLLDIGCGPGGQVQLARQLGYVAVGIDGDPACAPDLLHDFASSPGNFYFIPFDLVWMVEVLEHIDPIRLINLISCIKSAKARHIVITHALPGTPGHHHVNCQPPEYWEGFFAAIGYLPDDDLTAELKAASTMKREFIQRTGRVFVPAS